MTEYARGWNDALAVVRQKLKEGRPDLGRDAVTAREVLNILAEEVHALRRDEAAEPAEVPR